MLPALVRLVRPGNALMTGVAVAVAAFVAAGDALPWARVAVAAAVAFAFACAGNAANDLRDVAIDRRAHPDRPLPRGDVTRAQALALVIALYGAAVGGALVLGPAAVALVLGGLALMEAYERRLKAEGVVGNGAVALLTAAPFVLGGIAAGAVPAAVWALAGLAALATLGREILKDVEDMGADAGRRTLPQRIGPVGATRVAAGALGAAVLLSPTPYILGESVLGWTYLPAVCAADIVFLAAAATASRPTRAQRAAKVAMLLALVAFLVGRMQVVW